MHTVKFVLNQIDTHYFRLFNYDQKCVDHKSNQISFYHLVDETSMPYLDNLFRETNGEIVRFINSNYFYRVCRINTKTIRKYDDLIDQMTNQNVAAYVIRNTIQISKIEKKPKNAHLCIVNKTSDLYV